MFNVFLYYSVNNYLDEFILLRLADMAGEFEIEGVNQY